MCHSNSLDVMFIMVDIVVQNDQDIHYGDLFLK